MSFIDDSIKNVKNSVLKEVSGGGVAGFTGRAGRGIDAVFAGGYHPDSGHGSKNLELLKKQIEDRKKKIKDTDSFEANPVGGWYDINTETNKLAYEELITTADMVKQYNDENTPPQDVEWEIIDNNIYDDIYIHIDDEDDFINQSEKNMKYVGIDIKYDDKSEYAGKDFINNTNNWKLVGSK